MVDKLKKYWNELPHGVQATLVTFGVGGGLALLNALGDGTCYAWSCFKHSLEVGVGGGLAALRVFYMVPNKPQPPPEQK